MKWEKKNLGRVSVKSWCENVEEGAMKQVIDLCHHPSLFSHIALMADCHQGYGMPIGGVIACDNAIIPNAVGVDIGCGVCAAKSSVLYGKNFDADKISQVLNIVKEKIPKGEGKYHKQEQKWDFFNKLFSSKGWNTRRVVDLAKRSLGTLGGGNHFIEMQKDNENHIWLMIHSGSRNLGHTIASYYNKKALEFNKKNNIVLPNWDLAFFYADSKEGKDYILDMKNALSYAKENRKRMMKIFKNALNKIARCEFLQEIDIHHNYANLEEHFSKKLWIHRKGATSSKRGEFGIIPGSMGASSYITKGLGNKFAFSSSAHGAGRKMSRTKASSFLSLDDCNKDMKGIVFDGWGKARYKKKKNMLDLAEAPKAYKDIHKVIKSSIDLVEIVVELKPIGVVKG